MNPCTSLAEFSLKKRWRYMRRTSAWQPRFRTSGESLMSSRKASAAGAPRSESSSRENSCGAAERRMRRRRRVNAKRSAEPHLVGQGGGQGVVPQQQSLGNLRTRASSSVHLKLFSEAQFLQICCRNTSRSHPDEQREGLHAQRRGGVQLAADPPPRPLDQAVQGVACRRTWQLSGPHAETDCSQDFSSHKPSGLLLTRPAKHLAAAV